MPEVRLALPLGMAMPTVLFSQQVPPGLLLNATQDLAEAQAKPQAPKLKPVYDTRFMLPKRVTPFSTVQVACCCWRGLGGGGDSARRAC
jgi:hypothetical protein